MFTTSHSPFDAKIFNREAKSLHKAGYDVFIIALYNKKINKDFEGIHVITITEKNRLLKYVKIFYEGLKIRADIYHCHDDLLSLFLCVIIKILTGKKIIYDIHEHHASQIPYDMLLFGRAHKMKHIKLLFLKLLSSFIGSIINLYNRFFIPFTDYLIVINDSFKDIYSWSKKPVAVLLNVPSKNFKPEVCSNNKDNDKFILCFAGGIQPETRGLEETILALKEVVTKYKNVELMIVGKYLANNIQMKWFKNFTTQNNIKVKFVDFVPYNMLPNYIRKSNVGLVLNKPVCYNYEISSPQKQFEYMACGKPIIASNLKEIAKVVNEEKCGIVVDPRNPMDIAHAIIYLIEHPEEAKKMGENGRRAVEEKYNWEIMETRLLKVYKNLMK